jgi:hypothetical protein
VEETLSDGDRMPLMRLRHSGSAHYWGLAIHTPSSGRYESAPWFVGTHRKALDLVCDPYVTTLTE